MREVSCKAFDIFFREFRKRKLSPQLLVEGTPHSIEHLKNGQEWVDWATYVQVVDNLKKVFSEEDFERIGGAFFEAPLFRAISVIARLLFTTKELYRWGYSDAGPTQIFKCSRPSYRELADNRVEIELVLLDGYAPCRELFVITRGGMIMAPKMLGLPPATVIATELPNGMRYDVTFPVGGGALAWLRRAIAWPFTVRAAARELKAANEVLVERYHELDHAKDILALQKTQLATAHSISLVIRGDLDLDHTLRAVTRALVDEAKLSAVEIHLGVEVGGRAVAPHGFGERTTREPIVFPIEGRARIVGDLHLWTIADSDEPRLRELLQVVLPTIAMAIEDAITYTELVDYRQNLEQRVEQRTAELRQARDTLQETVRKMVEAQEARDRIFANINHEIRTPLALVMTNVEDVRRRQWERLDERARRSIDSIEFAGRKLLRLIDALLHLAAAHEGKITLQRRPFDLAELLQTTVSAWATSAEAHRLALAYRGPHTCVVDADEAQVDRMVSNLLANAIKFTPDGGAIDVALVEQADAVEVAVRDTGIGITPEFRSRIFGRFEKGGDPVRPGVQGSGVGLSLVRELARAHGGDVTVDSPPVGGSLFTIRLPHARAAAAAERAANGNGANRAAPADFGLGAVEGAGELLEPERAPLATLLVAEDEPELRAAIGRILVDEGYRVALAPDGAAALRLADRHHPELLVSDVGMPQMDGFELTRRFRELPGNRLAPVVLLTAYAKLTDRLTGFDAGAIDYVLKPFDPAELRARIRSQLELRSTALKLSQSEKLAALGTLSAGLAHEMRNPANAIVNAIDPLRDLLPAELLAPDQPVAQLLQVTRDCAEQVARLSRQLLDFKRSGELVRQETPFGNILGRAIALVQPSLRSITLQDEDCYEGPVWCAGALITQVLANLIENGAQAAGAGGWVKVEAHLDRGRLVVDVSDSGPGVPVALRDRIFEPFFTTKPPGQGNGLGLSTSRDIVERHGGSLEVRDGNRGTFFRMELPFAQKQRAEQSVRTGAAP